MSLKTVVTKRVFGFDPTKAEKYVVRSVVSGKISNKKLLVLVSQICGAHRGIVQQVVAGVIDAMVNMLEEGMSVELGDFGTFRPAIRAKAADTRADATANTIYRRRIVFTPGEALRDMLEKPPFNLIPYQIRITQTVPVPITAATTVTTMIRTAVTVEMMVEAAL